MSPTPVEPSSVQVPNIALALEQLGVPQRPSHDGSMVEIEILDGRSVKLVEGEVAIHDRISVCVVDVRSARQEVKARYGFAHDTPDTMDPQTGRGRGRLMWCDDLTVTAVHCPRAETSQVPCDAQCSPHRKF
jgi:hypothetical protein